MNDKTNKIKKKRKPGGGRKSVYNENFHPKMAKILAETGKIDKEIAKEIGVSEVTLNNWKKAHPEFAKSLKKGKEIPDDKVEKSLFERANGYDHPETKVFCYKGKVITHTIMRHYPKDTLAEIFWLKNRRPEKWRDKQEIKHEYSEDFKAIVEGIMSKKGKKLKSNK